MNGNETKILTQVATHIEHIMAKQTIHDKKLDTINEKLGKGASKIAANREAIEGVEKKTDNILKYGLSSLVVVLGGIIGGLVWLGKLVLGKR